MNAQQNTATDMTLDTLANALSRADALDDALMRAIDADHFQPFDLSDRIRLWKTAAMQ